MDIRCGYLLCTVYYIITVIILPITAMLFFAALVCLFVCYITGNA